MNSIGSRNDNIGCRLEPHRRQQRKYRFAMKGEIGQLAGKDSPAQAGAGVMPFKLEGDRILILDQRELPQAVKYLDATDLPDMCYAIREMAVRGAPSIGIAAALGLAAEAKRLSETTAETQELLRDLNQSRQQLNATRPTAVNLRWATDLLFELAEKESMDSPAEIAARLTGRARQMLCDHIDINRRLSEHGAALISKQAGVLTHCNTGSLAACGWGTALGAIRFAAFNGANPIVYVDETRPRQQGARLTTWELLQDGITPHLVTDSMAGHLMLEGKVDLVIVGADRIAVNGDAANKIGTYSLAVLAGAHNIPFYVAAPLSTIDPECKSGDEIPIEERAAEEITTIGGISQCPPGTQVYNPAFDVTPARYITAIITEAGILRPPYAESIPDALATCP